MIDFKMTKELMLALVFFVVVILFGFWYLTALIPLVFIVLFNLYKKKELKLTMTLLDIAFAFIGIGEIITSFFSSYKETGSNTSINIYIILILYIVYRNYFKSHQKKVLFSTVLFFLAVIIALITLVTFGFHYSNLLKENVIELNNFKNLYNPLGIWSNLWACILLLLLVFTILFVLQQRNIKFKILGLFVLLLLVFGIVVSFSRGIYLSVIFFILSLNIIVVIFKQLEIKQLIIVNFITVTIIFLAVSMVSEPVLTTLAFNKTTSQQRSVSGRLDKWENGLQLISDKPVTGWGNNNYILARDKNSYLGEDGIFSSKIDNTYLQILVEKGFLGFSTYLFLFITCLIIVYRSLKSANLNQNQKLEVIVVLCGLMAFLVRELTFSSLFVNNAVFFLAFHLVFFLIPYDIGWYKISVSKKIINPIIGVLFLFSSFLIFSQVKYAISNNQNNQFVKAFNKNDTQAYDFLDKAIKSSPNNIILNKHSALLLSKNPLQIDMSHKYDNLLEFRHVNKDTLEISKKYLRRVLELNPHDDETYHNLGWIYFALKIKDSAQICLNKALKLKPYNSTFRISKLLYDIKNSNFNHVSNDLGKAIRYTPDMMESIFYREFSKKYQKIALVAERQAILGLRTILKTEDNHILKARLARLLLETNPIESLKLLEEVSTSLPNLSRPWTYRAFLLEKIGDTINAKEFYKKGIFFDEGDFLSKLYYADFLKRIGDDKKSVTTYKEALQSYDYLMSENFMKNREMFNFNTIQNSYIPNDLLYFVKPIMPNETIFNYFINYYKGINDVKSYGFYKSLSEKYQSRLYKGKEILY